MRFSLIEAHIIRPKKYTCLFLPCGRTWLLQGFGSVFACRSSNLGSIPSWGGRVARLLLQRFNIRLVGKMKFASLEANLGGGQSLFVYPILLFSIQFEFD